MLAPKLPQFDLMEDLVVHAIPQGTLLFERYVVETKIAEGAVASVYRASDQVTDEVVALKVFDPLRSADPVARKRFEREFQLLSQLSHPGIARSLAFLRGGDFDMLVLEYIEGERLADRMRSPMAIDAAVDLAVRCARALEACHARGIVHRDLKPANIVIHPTRGPVLLDFGVAWFSSAMTLTRTGAVVGSPRYLAPEAFTSAQPDERVDIYSLGAILFEALTGRPVRIAESVAELALLEDEVPPTVRTLRSDCPESLERVVARAIASRPEDRFATIRELADALERGSVDFGGRLEARISCSACQTPLVVDLPICPGCGQTTDWDLEPGPYAVQLSLIKDPQETMRWLRRRHRSALRSSRMVTLRRLHDPQVPLVVGASKEAAESLAAQAQKTGCSAEIIRARAVIGPLLTVPQASANELIAASLLHLSAVFALGVLFSFLAMPDITLHLLPIIVAFLGMALAYRYVRRPLLAIREAERAREPDSAIFEVRRSLSRLHSPRARRLAAAAVARATPLLMGDSYGLSQETRQDLLTALERALQAALDLDQHQDLLEQRPRAQLRAALSEATSRQETDRVAALEVELDELTEVSLAYDLAARDALQACEEISAALSTRVTDH